MLSLILYTTLAWVRTCVHLRKHFQRVTGTKHKIPKQVRAALSSSASDIQLPFVSSQVRQTHQLPSSFHIRPSAFLQDFLCSSGDPLDPIFPNERHHAPYDPGKKSSLTCRISTAKATEQNSGLVQTGCKAMTPRDTCLPAGRMVSSTAQVWEGKSLHPGTCSCLWSQTPDPSSPFSGPSDNISGVDMVINIEYTGKNTI